MKHDFSHMIVSSVNKLDFVVAGNIVFNIFHKSYTKPCYRSYLVDTNNLYRSLKWKTK